MSDAIGDVVGLLVGNGARIASPVSALRLREAELMLGGALPEQLRALYLISDGIVMPQATGWSIHGLDGMLAEAQKMGSTWSLGDAFRPLPLGSSDGLPSGYVISAGPAIKGLVVWCPLDDSASVAFPDLASFLACLVTQPTSEFWDPVQLMDCSPGVRRFPEFDAEGRELVELAGSSPRNAGQALVLAIPLLGRASAPVLEGLLRTPYAASVEERLRGLGLPETVERAERELSRYREVLVAELGRLGVSAELVEDDPSLVLIQGGVLPIRSFWGERVEASAAAREIRDTITVSGSQWSLLYDGEVVGSGALSSSDVLAYVQNEAPKKYLSLMRIDGSFKLEASRERGAWQTELYIVGDGWVSGVVRQRDIAAVVVDLVDRGERFAEVEWSPEGDGVV